MLSRQLRVAFQMACPTLYRFAAQLSSLPEVFQMAMVHTFFLLWLAFFLLSCS